MKNNKSYIEDLYEQLEKTKLCHLNASHRLKANGNFLEFVNVFYSIIIATISIFSICFKSVFIGESLSISSTILSVALIISIAYANSIKFKERSQKFKDNYVNIQNLQYRLQNLGEYYSEHLYEIENIYTNLLKETENHIPQDLYKMIIDDTSYTVTERKNAKSKYLWHILWTYTVRILLVIFPVVFVLMILRIYYFE